MAFFEAFGDGEAAGVEFGELEEAVADVGDGDFVEFAGGFFAVAGDEGDGTAFADEFGGGGDLGGAEFEFGGDAGDVVGVHGGRGRGSGGAPIAGRGRGCN